MNESAREQYEVRINTLKPYLDQNEDPELARRASALLEGMREIAEQSADALAFEEALCASPLNTEYGIVYGELLAKNGSPSAREVAAATVQRASRSTGRRSRAARESRSSTRFPPLPGSSQRRLTSMPRKMITGPQRARCGISRAWESSSKSRIS